MQHKKTASRERACAWTIAICFSLLLISLFVIRFLKVDVVNIEHVDRNLYTVITEKGSIELTSNDVLRIERNYTKSPLSGENIELDKIYTDKGFIYISSEDSFYPSAEKLINSVDFDGLATWEKPNTDWKTVKQYSYMIGTPEKLIPVLFLFLSIEYVALSVGALALTIMIFPLRFREEEEEEMDTQLPNPPQDKDFSSEESYTMAK